MKRKSNFLYPTVKVMERRAADEKAFAEINKPKGNLSVVTKRHAKTMEEIHQERIQRRMAVA